MMLTWQQATARKPDPGKMAKLDLNLRERTWLVLRRGGGGVSPHTVTVELP